MTVEDAVEKAVNSSIESLYKLPPGGLAGIGIPVTADD